MKGGAVEPEAALPEKSGNEEVVMKTEGGKWVKVRILKHMISIYGSHFPGAIVTVPEHVAKNWIKNDIAELDGSERPGEIPKGQFWCEKHLAMHKRDSAQGKRCLKRIATAAAKAAAKAKAAEETEAALVAKAEAEAEAEAKALAEAEAAGTTVENEAEAAVAKRVEEEEAPAQEPATEIKVEDGEEAEVTGDGTGEALPEVESEPPAENE